MLGNGKIKKTERMARSITNHVPRFCFSFVLSIIARVVCYIGIWFDSFLFAVSVCMNGKCQTVPSF